MLLPDRYRRETSEAPKAQALVVMIKLSRRKMPHGPRRHGHRVSRGVLVLVVLVALGFSVVGGRLLYAWWQRPSIEWVPLPPGIEEGETLNLGPGIRPACTNYGYLEYRAARIENREWVVDVKWVRTDGGADEEKELRLGESVYLEGLGTITLTAVRPRPVFTFPWEETPWNDYVKAIFNLELEPGIILL